MNNNTQPPKNFEDYIFYAEKTSGSGLIDVPASAFQQCPGKPGMPGVSSITLDSNTVNSPPVRHQAVLAYDSVREVIVLFGGSSNAGGGTFYDDTWEWNGIKWNQISTFYVPPVNSIDGPPCMAYDAARGEIVLFTSPGETWSYNGSNWIQKSPATSPATRDYAAMAYDPIREKIVMFGGYDLSGPTYYDETWEWDGTDWSLITPATTTPSARWGVAMAYDGNGIMMFGGNDLSVDLNETWRWDGTDWTQLAPATSPSARAAAAITNYSNDTVLLHGGYDGTAIENTWQWNGTNWTDLNPAHPPSGRTDAYAAYDSNNNEVILFGGLAGATYKNETWKYVDNDWQISAVYTEKHVVINLPFNFNFCNVNYSQIAVGIDGDAVLIDPNCGITYAQGDYFVAEGTVFEHRHSNIKHDVTNSNIKEIFASNEKHVVLMPWGDQCSTTFNNYSLYSSGDPDEFGDPYYSLLADDIENLKNGIVTDIDSNGNPGLSEYLVDEVDYAVRHCVTNTKEGPAFVVRWNVISGHSFTSSSVRKYPQKIKFEIVLYKNGKIQFRYPKRSVNVNSIDTRKFNTETTTVEIAPSEFETISKAQIGASVGIFANWHEERFRDFSHILKYSKDSRQMYVNGGAIKTAGYTDSGLGGIDQATDDEPYGVAAITASYNCNLNLLEHWPAPNESGMTFNFIPPQSKKKTNRRDIEPTATNSIIDDSFNLFDDERTVAFNTSSVSYPAGLPASFVSNSRYKGISQTSNLHSSGSIVIDKVVKQTMFDSALDIIERKLQNQDAYNESARFEINRLNQNYFYFGSDNTLGEDVRSFNKSLHSKEQIRLSFKVQNNTRMLGDKCSMYYFNLKNGMWNIPKNAVGDIKTAMGNTSINTKVMSEEGSLEPFGGATTTVGSYFVEEAIGFDSYGNPIVSGSLNVFRTVSEASLGNEVYKRGNQTFNEVGYKFGKTSENAAELLMGDYPNSIQRNQNYNASKEETFTIPIKQPFLIEKVIVEVPIKLGTNWFADRTVTMPLSASYDGLQLNTSYSMSPNQVQYLIDEGGPGITFSLFCQKPYGRNKTIRDLITKRVVTHADDVLGIGVRLSHEDNPIDSIRKVDGYLQGIPKKQYPQFVSGSNNQFSGSIQVLMIPSISNSVKVLNTYNFTKLYGSSRPWPPDSLKTWLRSSKNNLKDAYIFNLDTFGRAMTGFSPSGGSIFGREYTTDQSLSTNGSHANNFYCESDEKYDDSLSTITDLTNTFTSVSSIDLKINDPVVLVAEKSSPYLLMPGEELVFAASKTRPALKTVKFNITSDGSDSENTFAYGKGELVEYEYANTLPNESIEGHDVQFSTGNINITIYGSYVKSNSELLNR